MTGLGQVEVFIRALLLNSARCAVAVIFFSVTLLLLVTGKY